MAMALTKRSMVSRRAPIIELQSPTQLNCIKYTNNQMSKAKSSRSSPADFIKQLLGRAVQVKLNDNDTSYTGTLCCLDGTMNILLTNARELQGEKAVQEWKQLLIRGNNVLYIKKNY